VRSADGAIDAFLQKDAAEGWAKTRSGTVLDFAGALNAIVANP
jgi:hypothetical protein